MLRGWGGGASWAVGLGFLIMGIQPVAAQTAPQPKGRGAIVVRVLDAEDDQPIRGATVQVVGGEAKAITGADGKGRVDLPAGTYAVKVTAPDYGPATVERLVVTVGKAIGATAKLTATKVKTTPSTQTVEVTGVVKQASEATQLQERKDALVVADNLGAEAIAKTTDSDAGEVVTRVTAVTVKDDKFIIVRGLGERYSNALLNGTRLPSTDPNRRIVPLDIFPADFIEALNLIKTYTPDLPGDFAAGLVDVKLAAPPTELTYGLSTSLSFNTETTFQDYDTYAGPTADWFTLGDNKRALPGAFDIFPQNPSSSFTPSTTQMRSLVGSLANNWNINSNTAPPNFSVDGFVGDTWGPFGFNFATSYGWKYSVHRGEVQNSYASLDQVNQDTGEIFTYDVSDIETQLGAVFTSQYAIDERHRLLARALVNRQSIDQVQNGNGFEKQKSADVELFPVSSQYTASQLGFGAIEGVHDFSWISLDWRGSWAPSQQNVPDAKFYTYVDQPPPSLSVDSTYGEAQRTWTELNEFLQDYYVDAIVPFHTALPFTDVWRGLEGKVKTGANYALRDRTFLYQSYITSGTALAGDLNLALPPNSLMVPDNFSTNGPLRFTRFSYQPFDASQEIAAGYGMVDLPLVEERLRFIGGARVEYSYISGRAYQDGKGFQQILLNDLDPLPSASLVYTPLEEMNVRAAFSQTVSRPEFRELTPVKFAALPGERILVGNPDLISASITNWDLRWEWFFTPLELVSAGFFYKELENPIEVVTGRDAAGGVFDIFVNYDNASLWGLEFEGRKDFAFAVPYVHKVSWLEDLAPHLADVRIEINASVVDSTTSEEFAPVDPTLATVAPAPGEKPLQGQPPFLVNASLEYEHYRWGLFRLLYNTVGNTIEAKGTKFGESPAVPDIESQRRDQLDFVWLSDVNIFGTPFSTKFAVENILNDVFEDVQGPRVTSRYRTGVTFSTGISYSF